MVSPELLRRFPFFGFLTSQQYNAVAMIAHEIAFEKDTTILEHDQPAEALYLVLEGSTGLYYVVTSKNDPDYYAEYYISDFDPGEIFGISALVEPYIYTGTIKASTTCRVLKIDAASLRALCDIDAKLAFGMMREVARSAMQRLEDTRALLVSARKSTATAQPT
ncbi:MAG: Crp/Fnr family transcriptional regulator [Chloroflexota bacterium]